MEQFWNLVLFYASLVAIVAFCIYLASRSTRRRIGGIEKRLSRIEKSFRISSELASKDELHEASAVAMSAASIASEAIDQVGGVVSELDASDEVVRRVKATQVEALRSLASLQEETTLHSHALSMLMSEVGMEMPTLPSPERALDNPSVQEILDEGDDTSAIESTPSTSS